MPPSPTRVFISYSHDSPAHMNGVLDLANRLRKEGIDCWIDQYVRSPSEGWPKWCDDQIETAKFVLVVCTEAYLRRFRGKEEPGKGRGVTFEGSIITQELYNSQGKNEKFIPIVLAAGQVEHIPILLQGASNYDVSTTEGYDELYFGILGQPRVTLPDLGPTRNRQDAAAAHAPLPKLESHNDFASQVSNVPFAPNPFFTGRESTFEAVHKKLESSKRVALSGMRGVGKTRTAVEYVHRHRERYNAILWARAETSEALVADFASIARLLKLPEKDEKDQSVIVGAVKTWLETNNGWLLVLDNADGLALVQQFVPVTHPGHVLLTTTAQALGKVAEKVLVEKMTEDEGALLLLRRANVIDKQAGLEGASDEDRELARQLAHELGGLPLALDQAGAFIEETPSTVAEYLNLYQKEGKRLRKERGELRSEHPSVTVTFSLAFAELAKRDAVAADLVCICAFLAPDAIPEEIFTRCGAVLGEEFEHRAENPLDFAEILKQAAKFSLIQRDAPDHSLDIHRLVQEVLKDEMDAAQHREWAERAVRAVNIAFPAVEFPNWSNCERLMPHAKICAALIDKLSFEFEEAARLLNQMASYALERARYGEAEHLFQRVVTIYKSALGPENRHVATGLNNLAALYRQQGRYPEAELLHRQALTMDEKVLDPDDPALATDLNNLGALYFNQGRYAEAEPLHQRALAIRERALGPEHSTVAISLNNLAELYASQERYADAESLHKRSLAIREKALGPEHPSVATSLNNLAVLYFNQGRHAEAEPLLQRALVTDERALGPEHPGLATDLNNLAQLYKEQRRYAEAVPLYQRALAIWEKVLGPDHPEVATGLGNYATLLRNTGRETEALTLEARAKEINERKKS
jgi:tetratricopeptide (TPR) repeat protein